MRSIMCYFQQQAHILKLWAIRLMTEENNTTDNSNQLTMTNSLYCQGGHVSSLKVILYAGGK